MINNLPSFQIEVTEENIFDTKNIIHRIGINTSRICKNLKPEAKPADQVQVEKQSNELAASVPPKFFYSDVAKQLSALNETELSNNFSDLRVCFKHTRSEKNMNLHFRFFV